MKKRITFLAAGIFAGAMLFGNSLHGQQKAKLYAGLSNS